MAMAQGLEVVSPTESEAATAEDAGRRLAELLEQGGEVRLSLGAGPESEDLTIPRPALRLLARALAEMGRGHGVALSPLHAELTTQEAADLLNVSRPHVVKLLDEGGLPSRKVGTYRRVRLDDALAYKRDVEARRHAALDELQTLGQDLGMGHRAVAGIVVSGSSEPSAET